jgi:hypothetical protein
VSVPLDCTGLGFTTNAGACTVGGRPTIVEVVGFGGGGVLTVVGTAADGGTVVGTGAVVVIGGTVVEVTGPDGSIGAVVTSRSGSSAPTASRLGLLESSPRTSAMTLNEKSITTTPANAAVRRIQIVSFLVRRSPLSD